jgi:hypothetical protein
MMKRTISLGFLCTVFLGNFAFAESTVFAKSIRLTDTKEITAASELNQAINAISKQVMSCVKQNAGKMEGCHYTTYEAYKFKPEYALAEKKFCEVISSFPSWRGKSISFSLPKDPMSYGLGMKGLEKQFGGGCN